LPSLVNLEKEAYLTAERGRKEGVASQSRMQLGMLRFATGRKEKVSLMQ